MYEIERKFLLNRALEEVLSSVSGVKAVDITQTYLRDTGDWAIRVREMVCGHDSSHVLTMKRFVSQGTNIEIENTISPSTYETFLKAGVRGTIRKTRHSFLRGSHIWEIDQFHNRELNNLVVAEVELGTLDSDFEKPEWLGREVTDDPQYSNAAISDILRRVHA